MPSVGYSESSVGDRFVGRLSVTSWHVMTGAALFADPGPNHVDFEHVENNRFGARIVHGFTTAGMMMSLVGDRYGWSIEAFLETNIKFLAPVFENENIDVVWDVKAMEAKPAFSGGIVYLEGRCWAGPERRYAVVMETRLALSDYTGPDIQPPTTDTEPLT